MRTLSSRARKTHLWTSITCPEDLICEQREWATAIATDKAHQKIIIGQGRPIVRVFSLLLVESQSAGEVG